MQFLLFAYSFWIPDIFLYLTTWDFYIHVKPLVINVYFVWTIIVTCIDESFVDDRV